MEFIDNLVLPQSAEHIVLLHIMLMVVLFLFVPFFSMVLGGTSLSLYLKRKGLNSNDENSLKFAKDVIETTTVNKSVGLILGIVPLFTLVIIMAQLLHKTNAAVVGYLTLSFLLATTGMILIYIYRYSFSYHNIFSKLSSLVSNNELANEVKNITSNMKRANNSSGMWGLIFLFCAAYFYIAAIVLAYNPAEWETNSVIFILVSWSVFSKFLYFLSSAAAITGGVILFLYFYWEGGKQNLSNEYSEFVKKISIRLTFTGALFLPIFLLINTIALPEVALTSAVFGLSFLSLLLLFAVYHFLFLMVKNSNVKFSAHVFLFLIASTVTLIVSDQLAMTNATKNHSAVLALEYDEMVKALKASGAGLSGVNAEEIYNTRCLACHNFEQKLVGPAYKDVLPKYNGDIDKLAGFIRNPVKVDPAFPPMPNQGLKPNEAKAIAVYLFEKMKNQ
jgi:cytochrome c